MAQVNPFGTRQTINPNISNQAKRPYKTPIQDTHFSTPHEIETKIPNYNVNTQMGIEPTISSEQDDLLDVRSSPTTGLNRPSKFGGTLSTNPDLFMSTVGDSMVASGIGSPPVNNPQQRNVTQNAGSVEGDFTPETNIIADISNYLSTLGGRPKSAPTMGDGSAVPIHGIRNDQTPAEHLDEYGKLIDVNEPLRAANNLNTNRITSGQSVYDPYKQLNLTGEAGKVEATAANTKDFEETKELQTNLNAEHGANLVVDGIMGPKTRAAMEAAQQGTSTNPFPFEDPTWSSTASNPLSTTDESGIIDPNKGMRGSFDSNEGITGTKPKPEIASSKIVTSDDKNLLGRTEDMVKSAYEILFPSNEKAAYKNAINIFTQGTDYAVDTVFYGFGEFAKLANTILTDKGIGREERKRMINDAIKKARDFTDGVVL